ncbi:MAG: hypothetical protein K2F95_04030 [Alistipes sp.]|nr:hypothetical protein [Alistipes sp.]MDE7129110.1 hypothetical protein [Alistipes sp.]
MINHLRFLYVICALALVFSAPFALWSAANGALLKAIIFAVVALCAFVCLLIVRRNLRYIKQMNATFDRDDVKPV